MILLLACTDPPSVKTELEAVDYGRFTTDADGRLTLTADAGADDVAGTLECGPFGFEATATLADGGSLATRANPATDAFTLAWPQAPGAPSLDNPTVTLQFTGDNLPLTVSCTGIRRFRDVPEEGTLGVDFRFGGVVGLDQYTAGESASWLAVQTKVEALFRDVGIGLDVRYSDTASTLSNPADEVEAGEFVKSEVDGEPGDVPVLLVQSLGYTPGPGHVPGWYGTGGTGASGVVVAAGTFTADPDGVALDIAAEIGHFLGLFHVEEADGTADPLADTDPADGNPMSYSKPGGAFSADQGWVMRSSIAVD